MKRILLVFILLSFAAVIPAKAVISGLSTASYGMPGPGDEEKEKEKEEKMKTKKSKLTAAKMARLSARDAKRATLTKNKEIAARASVRNFYHNTFNTKPGKAVNYRKQHKRNTHPYRGKKMFRKKHTR